MAIINGTAGNDNLAGTADADMINGVAGNDILDGGYGDDILNGGAGNDLLRGSFGGDTLDGGAGIDTADYSAEDIPAGLSINLVTGEEKYAGTILSGKLANIENVIGSNGTDVITGDANSNILDGSAGNDTLNGGAGDDILDGGRGNDVLNGGDGNDVLSGNFENDTFDGGAGIDTVDYTYFGPLPLTVDLTTGQASSAAYPGPGGVERLSNIENARMGAGDDIVIGSSGANVLEGAGGTDILNGRGGADRLDGGAGIDWVTYQDETQGAVVDLATGAASGAAAGDTYISIENIRGSEFNDVLTGDAGPNTISGFGGSDLLSGGAGNDGLAGGDGDDVLNGEAGADVLNGGAGRDWASYRTDTTAAVVNLATGATSGAAAGDTYIGIENLGGSNFDDHLTGDSGDNTITGFDGNDLLDGGAGADGFDAGNGDDVMIGGAGADQLNGGAGSDWASYETDTQGALVHLATGATFGAAAGDTYISIENVAGSNFDDLLTGDAGANIIAGNAGNDILTGGDGSDILRGGAGGDTLDGGNDIDAIDYSGSTAGVAVNLGGGTASGGDAQGDSFTNIENVTGSSLDDILTGDAAVNQLTGGDGNDTLEGAGGADHLVGGNGTDAVVYSLSGVGVSVNLATGATSGGDAAGDTFDSIENLIGSALNDTLTGNAGANLIIGALGNDFIDGGAGNDTLFGGDTDDTLMGGAGADRLDGGTGTDWASYQAEASGVGVNLATGNASGAAAGDTYVSIENVAGSNFDDQLTGDAGANTLAGNGDGDTLDGGAGTDILNGGDGDDALRGGAGADVLDGGAGRDTAGYYTSAAGVTVDLAAGTGVGGDAQGDTYAGIEDLAGSNTGNDVLTGDAGSNTLAGWGGDDLLRGGAGQDRLDGGAGIDTVSYDTGTVAVTINLAAGTGAGGDAVGDSYVSIENAIGSAADDQITGDALANALNGWAGRDVLTGGAGADRFVFTDIAHSVVGANADRITDFSRAQGDLVDLSAIDANTGVAGDQAFTFIGAGLFTGVAGQLRAANTSPGVTTIAGDVNGDGVSDFHIQLTGNLALVAADFVL